MNSTNFLLYRCLMFEWRCRVSWRLNILPQDSHGRPSLLVRWSSYNKSRQDVILRVKRCLFKPDLSTNVLKQTEQDGLSVTTCCKISASAVWVTGINACCRPGGYGGFSQWAVISPNCGLRNIEVSTRSELHVTLAWIWSPVCWPWPVFYSMQKCTQLVISCVIGVL